MTYHGLRQISYVLGLVKRLVWPLIILLRRVVRDTCSLAYSDPSKWSAGASILHHTVIGLLGAWIQILLARAALVYSTLQITLTAAGVYHNFCLTLIVAILAWAASSYRTYFTLNLNQTWTLLNLCAVIWIMQILLSGLVWLLTFFIIFDWLCNLGIDNYAVVFAVLIFDWLLGRTNNLVLRIRGLSLLLLVLHVEEIALQLPAVLGILSLVSNLNFLLHRNRHIELTILLLLLWWWHRFNLRASGALIFFMPLLNLFLQQWLLMLLDNAVACLIELVCFCWFLRLNQLLL